MDYLSWEVGIRIKDASNSGVSTNAAGKFSIKVSAEAKVPIFSSVGYSTQEIAISRSVVHASLETDSKSLSEVVVTALGPKREAKSLGYATVNYME